MRKEKKRIRYVPLFHPCFQFVLCQSALSCVFLSFFREFSHADVLFCVCFHARMTHFTFTLCLFKFPNNGSQYQNLFIGWICDSLNQSGHGGGTKREQSFLFGLEGWNALVSSKESMLSKCDDVITYATQPLNIQTRPESLLSEFRHFLKHSDRISEPLNFWTKNYYTFKNNHF